MSAALVQPDLRPVPGPWWRPSYELAEDYAVAWVGMDGGHRQIRIPRGLRTDGSTEWLAMACGLLPAALLWVLGVGADGPHRAAALVHDRLYQARQGTRAEADHAFRVLALAGGLPPWRAWPRWVVLRCLGWAWWST